MDVGRREAIIALGSGLVAAPLARSIVHGRLHGRLLRPPGSVPEPDFLNACLRCGRCMKACPTNGLQPTILESGFDGLWTPRLVPRIGACEKNCNLCGQVCPTAAIHNLPLEEKTYARIGTAVIDRSRCLAWEHKPLDTIHPIRDENAPVLVSLAAIYAPMDTQASWSRMVCAGMTEGGCDYFKANQADKV